MIICGKAIAGSLNTITCGHVAWPDGFQVRRATLKRHRPCLAAPDTARSALNASTPGQVIYNIKPVSEYLNWFYITKEVHCATKE